jgi:hypothetical protein
MPQRPIDAQPIRKGVTARVMMVSMKNTLQKIDESALEEIIRRIVEVAAPDRIILFGSAAR